ncbi:hypothetical protein [Methylobacterium sp. A54F]
MVENVEHTIMARIAAALGIPETAFRAAITGDARSDPHLAGLEEVELLSAFLRIEDPEARSACLAFVREAARRSTEP